MTVARTLSSGSTDRPLASQFVIRKLFTPKWILIHLGVASLIALMMNLGFWQLRRLDEKKTFNALVTERTSAPIRTLSPESNKPNFGSQNEWSRVSVTGNYDMQHAVTVVNRSQNGTAGFDTVVPLTLSNGSTVFVNRGFVPLATKTPEAPAGEVQVIAYVRNTQSRGALGAIDSTDISNTEFQRFDIELIGKRIATGNVLPYFLQRITETPATQSEWPDAVTMPQLDNGPHLSYAVQWFIFSTTALAAWVVVIRRRLRTTSENEDSQAPTAA